MLVKYLYRGIGPGLGTPTMALVSFNSMYLFGYSLEHVVSQNTDVVQMKRAHLTQYALATLRLRAPHWAPNL